MHNLFLTPARANTPYASYDTIHYDHTCTCRSELHTFTENEARKSTFVSMMPLSGYMTRVQAFRSDGRGYPNSGHASFTM